MFCWKFCEMFKNTFFTEYLRATASVFSKFFFYLNISYWKKQTNLKVPLT